MKKLVNFILNIIAIVHILKGVETEMVDYQLEDDNLFIDKHFIKRLLKAYKQDIIYNLYDVIEEDK